MMRFGIIEVRISLKDEDSERNREPLPARDMISRKMNLARLLIMRTTLSLKSVYWKEMVL